MPAAIIGADKLAQAVPAPVQRGCCAGDPAPAISGRTATCACCISIPGGSWLPRPSGQTHAPRAGQPPRCAAWPCGYGDLTVIAYNGVPRLYRAGARCGSSSSVSGLLEKGSSGSRTSGMPVAPGRFSHHRYIFACVQPVSLADLPPVHSDAPADDPRPKVRADPWA